MNGRIDNPNVTAKNAKCGSNAKSENPSANVKSRKHKPSTNVKNVKPNREREERKAWRESKNREARVLFQLQ